VRPLAASTGAGAGFTRTIHRGVIFQAEPGWNVARFELLPGARAAVDPRAGASRHLWQASGHCAWQENTFAVGAGGLLEYLPDPVIPLCGFCLPSSSTQFAPGAGCRAVCLGGGGARREAHGECFGYESFGWGSGRCWRPPEAAVRPLPVAVEQGLLLTPARRPLLSVARLGP
jgi:hypothetical protein